MSANIEDLDLGCRSYNCLVRAGLWTTDAVYEVLRRDGNLAWIRNLGRRSMREVMDKLDELGYDLSFVKPEWR